MSAVIKADSQSRFKVWSYAELEAKWQAEEAADAAAKPWEPAHFNGFVLDKKNQTIDIWWGGYEYWIDLDRIDTPVKLLEWIQHLSEKSNEVWDKGMTVRRVAYLIRCLGQHFKWPGKYYAHG